MERVYPDTKPPGMPPDDTSKHIKPIWYDVRNNIQRDQLAVSTHLDRIKQIKKEIAFFKQRIVTHHKTLNILGNIKE